MHIGYARVSTLDQNPALQEDALKSAGCEKIYIDKISGTTSIRPELEKLKDQLRSGDILVVWRLDRLGRSLKNLIEWMTWLEEEGIALKSLKESIDTSTSTGKLVFHIFGALAEFERNLISERTRAGLEAARARGKRGGRKPKLSSDKVTRLRELYAKKEMTIKELCEWAGVSKPTLYGYLRS